MEKPFLNIRENIACGNIFTTFTFYKEKIQPIIPVSNTKSKTRLKLRRFHGSQQWVRTMEEMKYSPKCNNWRRR